MHTTLKQLEFVQNKINEIINRKQLKSKPEIIVVSKTFSLKDVMPLLEYGHIHFGENKIQEAEEKWTEIKKNYKNLQLHMVGKLQSNKVKKAVKLFDFIHSLDNKKLALMISKYQKELKNEVKTLIFLREIVFLKCKKAKFPPGGLRNVKTPKTSFSKHPK